MPSPLDGGVLQQAVLTLAVQWYIRGIFVANCKASTYISLHPILSIDYTVCPISSDPFYIVSILNRSLLLGHTVVSRIIARNQERIHIRVNNQIALKQLLLKFGYILYFYYQNLSFLLSYLILQT